MADGADSVDRIAARTAAMQLDSNGTPPSASGGWGGLRLRIPNPFEAFASNGAQDEDDESVSDEAMNTASPRFDSRSSAVPVVPRLPRYEGNTMQHRRTLMVDYDTYLAAINVLRALGVNVVALPVSACIEGKTKRRIARFEWNKALHDVTEEQWIAYFRQAQNPSHINYAAVDESMKRLRMDTRLPEPESRMTTLQAHLEEVLDEYNLTELAYVHEPKRLVRYLTDALAPTAFKTHVVVELSRQENKMYKEDVFAFCRWVTNILRTYMVWERVSSSQPPPTSQGGRGAGGRGNGGSALGQSGTGAPQRPSAAGGRGSANGGGAGGRSSAHSGGGGGRGGRGGRGNTAGAPLADANRPAGAPSPCLKCGSVAHQVRDCGNLTYPGEAVELLRAWRENRRAANQAGVNVRRVAEASECSGRDRGTTNAVIDGVVVKALLLDSGADASLVAKGVVDALVAAGTLVRVDTIEPKILSPVGDATVTVTRVVMLGEVELTTSAGPLMLRNLACYVEESNLALEVTVGRPIMELLGYSTDEFLVRARDTQPEWELAGAMEGEARAEVKDASVVRVCRLQAAALNSNPSPSNEDVDSYSSRTATPTMTREALEKVIATLESRKVVAEKLGLQFGPRATLKKILQVRLDEFRLEFGHDPPVKVAPLEVRLKPDAVPCKAAARRMPPNDREFLERHVDALLKAGLVYRNPRSRWASAPRIVRKKEQDTDPTADPRMTVDERGVNERTEAMPWPMPILEVVIGELDGATVFFVLDWFRGYWQLPLHPNSQELFTFITHRGMYTPTRVPMGATDSVAYCQQVVEEVFGDLIGNGILCWLDDILGYAKTQDELMQLLDKVLERCAKFGLKLHAKKCQFFATEIKWCGRMISATGVRHCPDRVQGLVDMQPPRTAADLQQFLCAINWMRQSIPEYNKLTSGLYTTLEGAIKAAGSRKKAKLAKFLLVDAGWSARDEEDLGVVRDSLLRMVPLAHPRPDAELCLYTDASQDHWGAVLTQLETPELKLPLEEQHHKPLAFLSGRFAGASSRWATIEKEAFAIVEATRRLDYLLLRPRGFHLYTDHRNLVYVFDPRGVDSTMARYQADKLQRWALSLMAFRYVIEHVPGEQNAWGDLLSRWGAGPVATESQEALRFARLAVVERVSPLMEPAFVWPGEEEIKQEQQRVRNDAGGGWPLDVSWNEQRGLAMRGDAVWIPDAADLHQRFCVVAHAGASGHRGAKATTAALRALFWWPALDADVSEFVRSCLHCMITVGGKVPRPHGETIKATKPNEVLHFDFLTMGEAEGGLKYVFVLKDGMSGYVELVACAQADSDQAYTSLLDWFKRFGVVRQWVSDQGAHFKNQTIEKLRGALGSLHHFTTAYTPWANGTVEVVNRETLKAVKALLSERKLRAQDWPRVLPVVQSALNGTPADRLGGVAPLTAFTALPAGAQLRSILHPRDPVETTVDWVDNEVRQHLASVRGALDGMHAEMVDSAEKRKRAARERHARTKGVVMHKFSEGDFVLAATATGRRGNKLAVVWRGPKRIVRALTDYTFEVQDLAPPFAVTVRHASRLQLYKDADRCRDDELVDQAIYGDGGHLVEELRACALSPTTHRWEIQVKWLGLDEIDCSWEPAEAIREDVPVLYQRFVEAAPDDDDRRNMEAVIAGRPTMQQPPAPRLPRARGGAAKKKAKTA